MHSKQKVTIGIVRLMTFFSFLFGILTVASSVGAASQAEKRAALADLYQLYPNVKYKQGTHGVDCLYGAPFSYGGSPEGSAARFLSEYTHILSADFDELGAGSLVSDSLHSQPVMYDRHTDSYKFTLFYFRQYLNDVPVFRSEARLLVRNDTGYPLVLVKSSMHDLSGYVSRRPAHVSLAAVSSWVQTDNPGLDEFHEVEPVIWAGTNGSREKPRDAIQVIGSSDFPEVWLYVLDAATGEVLHKEDRMIMETVSGNVSGNASEGSASHICEDEILTPMPYVQVDVGSDSTCADSAGNYVLDGSFSGTVDVVSTIRGEHFYVIDSSGPEAMLSRSAASGDVVDFVHNEANTDESYLAQVNAYIAANQVRDFVLDIHPTYFNVLDNKCPTINVNLPNSVMGCPGNAWYRFYYPLSINFCASGYNPDLDENFSNTAFSSVVYHEYGHHLVEMSCSGQDQYGEGMSDCVGILLTDSPINGLGFFDDCERYVRNPVVSNVQFPCMSMVEGCPHYCGMVLSGSVWALREELYALYPTSYIDTLANLTINSILLHLGGFVTPQIVIDFLTLDDDDGDITNGTPHWIQICDAFSQYNMRCPRFNLLNFSYSEDFPEFVAPESSYTVQFDVSSRGSNDPVSGTGAFYYAIDGFDYQQGTMVELSANRYEITFPQVPAGGVINWYVTVESSESGTCYNPAYYDVEPYELIVATHKVLLFEDDFNKERGWTSEHSVEFLGDPWIRDIPSQDGPYSDRFYEDYDGSGYCYMTGNGDSWPGVGVGWSSLMSPELSLDGGVVRFDYARWWDNAVNSGGYGLSDDSFYVFVSADSGQNWTLAESLDPWYSDHWGGWFTDHMIINSHMVSPTSVMLKFMVEDNEHYLFSGNDAAIDAVRVYLFPVISGLAICTSFLPPATVHQPYNLQLEALGGSGGLVWSDMYNDLPAFGLNLSPSGIISGTPIASGSVDFTVEAVDGSGQSTERQYTLVIGGAFRIVNNFPDRYTYRGYLAVYFEVEGGSPPFIWSNPSNNLKPDKLGETRLKLGQFDHGSVQDEWGVWGRYYHQDSFTFSIAAEDRAGACDTMVVTIHTIPEVKLITRQLDTAYVGHPYEFQLESSGGILPLKHYDYYRYNRFGRPGESVGRNEMGLNINHEDRFDGLITGIPLIAGDFLVEVVLIDSAKCNWHSDEWHMDDYHFPTLTVAYKAACGDIAMDGIIDLTDLTFLISYLFLDGPTPDPIEIADVDASGEVDLGDVTRMISYLFLGGDYPVCPSPTTAASE